MAASHLFPDPDTVEVKMRISATLGTFDTFSPLSVIFAENKNDRNWLEKKDLEILSTDPDTEFSGGSF